MDWKIILFLQVIFLLVSLRSHEVSGQGRHPTPGFGELLKWPTTLGLHTIDGMSSFKPRRPATIVPAIKQSTRVTSSTTESTTVSSTTTEKSKPRIIRTLVPTRVTTLTPSPTSTASTSTSTTTTEKPITINRRPTRITTLTPSTTTTKSTTESTTKSTTTSTTQSTTSTQYPPYQRTVRLPPDYHINNRAPSGVQATPWPSTTQGTIAATSPTRVTVPAHVTRVTTPRSDKTQFVTFTIMNDYNRTVIDKEKFMDKLSRAVAIAAEVRDARITNFNIKPGSIIVDFQIQPGYEWETSAKDAAKVFLYNVEHMNFNVTSPEGVPLQVDINSVKTSSQTPAEKARSQSTLEIKYILFVVMGTAAVSITLILVTIICLRNNGDKSESKYYKEDHKHSLPSTYGGKYRLDTISDLGFHEDEKAM